MELFKKNCKKSKITFGERNKSPLESLWIGAFALDLKCIKWGDFLTIDSFFTFFSGVSFFGFLEGEVNLFNSSIFNWKEFIAVTVSFLNSISKSFLKKIFL